MNRPWRVPGLIDAGSIRELRARPTPERGRWTHAGINRYYLRRTALAHRKISNSRAFNVQSSRALLQRAAGNHFEFKEKPNVRRILCWFCATRACAQLLYEPRFPHRRLSARNSIFVTTNAVTNRIIRGPIFGIALAQPFPGSSLSEVGPAWR